MTFALCAPSRGMEQCDRELHMLQFARATHSCVLVCTDVGERGHDIKDVLESTA